MAESGIIALIFHGMSSPNELHNYILQWKKIVTHRFQDMTHKGRSIRYLGGGGGG